jgi:hypothetical protein
LYTPCVLGAPYAVFYKITITYKKKSVILCPLLLKSIAWNNLDMSIQKQKRKSLSEIF